MSALSRDSTETTSSSMYLSQRSRSKNVLTEPMQYSQGSFVVQNNVEDYTLIVESRSYAGTATIDDMKVRRIEKVAKQFEEPKSIIDQVQEQRIKLLAQKYEGLATREDNARLQILTQRLRKLAPRVTKDEVEALAIMVSEVETLSADIDELEAEFGN